MRDGPDPSEIYDRFTVPLEVAIRTCEADDLPNLEWFGMYTPHRQIIRSAYQQQRRGEGLMLVADMKGFPAGQAWIDLAKKRREKTGVIWAVRVLPPLRGLGIGARLMLAAENVLRKRGFLWAELGVRKGNEVEGFYERLGYRRSGTLREESSYTTPDGDFVRATYDQTVYRKRLAATEGA